MSFLCIEGSLGFGVVGPQIWDVVTGQLPKSRGESAILKKKFGANL
jgi:hypothetical protein